MRGYNSSVTFMVASRWGLPTPRAKPNIGRVGRVDMRRGGAGLPFRLPEVADDPIFY